MTFINIEVTTENIKSVIKVFGLKETILSVANQRYSNVFDNYVSDVYRILNEHFRNKYKSTSLQIFYIAKCMLRGTMNIPISTVKDIIDSAIGDRRYIDVLLLICRYYKRIAEKPFNTIDTILQNEKNELTDRLHEYTKNFIFDQYTVYLFKNNGHKHYLLESSAIKIFSNSKYLGELVRSIAYDLGGGKYEFYSLESYSRMKSKLIEIISKRKETVNNAGKALIGHQLDSNTEVIDFMVTDDTYTTYFKIKQQDNTLYYKGYLGRYDNLSVDSVKSAILNEFLLYEEID